MRIAVHRRKSGKSRRNRLAAHARRLNEGQMLLALPGDLLRWLCCMDNALTPMDVARMRRVCRQLRDALSADALWRVLHVRYWSGDARVLLVPPSAMEGLVQRQRFHRSDRAAAMVAARDRMDVPPLRLGESVFASFCRAVETFSMAAWPVRVFYIGLAEAGFANVTAGQLRAPMARVATYHENNGRIVAPNGRRLDGVSPASVPGSAR